MARSRTADAEGRRKYAGLSLDERRDARRRRLLDAALALYGGDGYQATSIERLCAASGVTARHFYEEFEGREALLAALYGEILEAARDAVLEAVRTASMQPEDRIERAVSAFLHSYLDDPRRARVATLEVVGVSAAMERRRREAMHLFAGLIETQALAMADAGSVAARDFGLASIALAGAGNELLVEWLWRERKPTIEDLARELRDLFVALVRGGRGPWGRGA